MLQRRRRSGLQIPKAKLQTNSKAETAERALSEFGHLKLPWDLEIGFWDFSILHVLFHTLRFSHG